MKASNKLRSILLVICLVLTTMTYMTLPASAQESQLQQSNEEIVYTPVGPMLKSHVHKVPNGSYVLKTADELKVYASRSDADKGSECILTIPLERRCPSLPPQPPAGGWIEWAHNKYSVSNIGRFEAYWTVPSSPPRFGGYGVLSYIFNSLSEPGEIIQPVLQYGEGCFGSNGNWYGASWYVWGGTCGQAIYSEPIDTAVGHHIYGYMQYWAGNNPGWSIFFQDRTANMATALEVGTVLDPDNVTPDIALEGYGISGDIDVPGDTTFTGISFKNTSGNSISVELEGVVDHAKWDGILTGLGVDVLYNSTRVVLNTVN